MITSGNRLLVLSLILTAMVVLSASPASAVFERGVRVKTTVAESTYVKIDVEDPGEADNPGTLGVGVASPGDKVRLLVHLQNTHNAASTVEAKDLSMLGMSKAAALTVVPATDETAADLALLSPDPADPAFPDAGNTGDGDFAANPTPDTTLWVDADWLEANATADSALHYRFDIECTDASDPYVFSVERTCLSTAGGPIACPDYTLGTAYYAQTDEDTSGCNFNIAQGATPFIGTDKLYIYANRNIANELYFLDVSVTAQASADWQNLPNFDVMFEYVGSDTDSVAVTCPNAIDTYAPTWGNVGDTDIFFDWDSDNAGMANWYVAKQDEILNPNDPNAAGGADWLTGIIDLATLDGNTSSNIGYVGFDFTVIANDEDVPAYEEAQASPMAYPPYNNPYVANQVAVLQADPGWAGTDDPAGTHTVTVTLWDLGGTSISLVSNATLPAIDNVVPDTGTLTEAAIDIETDLTIAGENTWLNPASAGFPAGDEVWCSVDIDGMDDEDDVSFALFDLDTHIDYTDPTTVNGWTMTTAKAPVLTTPHVEVQPGSNKDETNPGVDCLIIDDAGNSFYIASTTNTFPDIDNDIPVPAPGDITITGVDKDFTGAIPANPATPTDEITVAIDLTGIADEETVVAQDGEAFGETFTVNDNGTGADAGGADDHVWHGDVLLTETGIDGTEMFTVIVTDEAGNVSTPVASAAGLNMDTDVPTLTASNVYVAFQDDPNTPGVDGDVNGDGIVGDGDGIIVTVDILAEGLTDVSSAKLGQSRVQVDLELLDVTAGIENMTEDMDAGLWYYNHTMGSDLAGIEDELGATCRVRDDAGNETDWVTGTGSTVEIDQVPPDFDPGDIDFDFASGGDDNDDGIAGIGDMVSIDVTIPDAVMAWLNADPINGGGWVEMEIAKAAFTLELEVTEDGTGGMGQGIQVKDEDDAGNENTVTSSETMDLDPVPPTMDLDYVSAFLSGDHVGGVGLPGEDIVNVLDDVTFYYDGTFDGDIASVTVEATNYDGVTKEIIDLAPNFNGMGADHFGWVLTVAATGLDLPPTADGTAVMFTATDDAGNVSTGYFYPENTDTSLPLGGPARTPTYAAVDTDPPDTPVDQAFIVLGDLVKGNGIVNAGDRMDIIVNMGDPADPNYDMRWENTANGSRVFADLSHYGLGAAVELTDDEFSVGGEGDGQFSYVDGNDMQGFVVQGGDLDVAAGDDDAKVEVWARDDQGNVDQSKVLTLAPDDGAKALIPVDTELPMVAAADVTVTLTTDADGNGIANIGDTVLLSVDMTDAAAVDDITAVWALLAPWGDPTADDDVLYVVLTEGASDVWTFSHVIQRTDNVTLWDTGAGFSATVDVIAADDAGNFSGYNTYDPVDIAYTTSVVQELLVDATAPLPVTQLAAEILDSGRIEVTWTGSASADIHHYMVYTDGGTGTVDYGTPIGGPIDANTTTWVSDFLITEAKATWLFAVRGYDDGGNDDGDEFWVTGGTPDDSAPVATLASIPVGHTLGDGGLINASRPIMIHADVDQGLYPDVASCQFRYRIKDMDPDTAGDQPGPFDNVGASDATIPFELSTADLATAEAALLAAQGDVTLQVIPRVFDDAGNYQSDDDLMAAKAYYEFTLDTMRPDVTIFSVDGNPSPDNMEVSGVVPVVVHAQDNLSTEFKVSVWLDTDRILYQEGVTFTDSKWAFDLDLTNFDAGGVELDVIVYDGAGWIEGDASPNGGQHGIDLTVLDTEPPAAVIAWPYHGQRVPIGQQVGVTVYVPTSADVATVGIWMDDPGPAKDWVLVDVVDNTLDPWYYAKWNTTGLVDGESYGLKAEITDTSGNSDFTPEITVIADGTLPTFALSVETSYDICDRDVPTVTGTVEFTATLEGKPPVDIGEVDLYVRPTNTPDLWGNWTYVSTVYQSEPGPGGTGTTIFRFQWDASALAEGYDVRLISWDTTWWVTTGDFDGNGTTDDFSFNPNDGWCTQVWVDNSPPTGYVSRMVSGGNDFVDPTNWGYGLLWVSPGDDITCETTFPEACSDEMHRCQYWVEWDGTDYPVASSSTPPNFPATFNPVADGIIPPAAIDDGFETFYVWAEYWDVLGGTSTTDYAEVYMLDNTETQVFVTSPGAGAFVRGSVCLEAKRLDNYTATEYKWEYSTDNETWHLIKKTTSNSATWETLNSVADGSAWLRVTSTDQHLNTNTSPAVQVSVDNSVPTAGTLTGIPDMMGRMPVTLTTTATDASGIAKVVWQTKWSSSGVASWSTIATDECAPFSYEWDAWNWYQCSGQIMVRAIIHDRAIECLGDTDGNQTIVEVETTMDFCPPFGCLAMINDTSTLDSDLTLEFPAGQMTFYANATDNPAEMSYYDCIYEECCWNDGDEIIHSGVMGVQFQVYQGGWSDIGLPVTEVGQSGYYELMWDNGEWPQGTALRVRATVIDNAYNVYEGSYCCPEVYFTIGDDTPPVVTLRAIDPITGTLVYTTSTSEVGEIGEIEFRVLQLAKAESDWTIIGKRTGEPSNWGYCNDHLLWGSYDRWEFRNWPSGDYLLEARAFDVDHTELNPLYDVNPPTLKVRVDAEAQRVTVLPSGAEHFTSLEPLGIVEDYLYSYCEVINVEVSCDDCVECEGCCPGGPVLVFFGHDYPCDDGCDSWYVDVIGTEYNDIDGLWRQVEYYYLNWLGVEYEGDVTIVGSWWDADVAEPTDPEVDAMVATTRVFRVSQERGTAGPVSEDGVVVDIAPGNGVDWYGLRMAKVPQPPTPPHQQDHLTPVGDTRSICLIGNNPSVDNVATVTLPYCPPSPLKGSFQSLGLTVGRWDCACKTSGDGEWAFWDIWDVAADEENCTVTFKTSTLGIFSVIERQGLSISNCGPFIKATRLVTVDEETELRTYTNATPILMAYITDNTHSKNGSHVDQGVIPSSIKAVLNGITIFSNGTFSENWTYANDLGFSSSGQNWYDSISGLFAIEALNENEFLHPGEMYTLELTARNNVYDKVSATCEFYIDRTRPVIDWTAGPIGPNFDVQFTITDTEAGVDPRSIYLDFYGVRPDRDDPNCCDDSDYAHLDGTEIKEYRMQLTPDALTITEDENGVTTVLAEDISMDLIDGELLEVVLYSYRYCNECADDYDYEVLERDEVIYDYDYGVYDRVYDYNTSMTHPNMTLPVVRRYMVDATPPESDILTSLSAETMQIKLTADCISDPIDPSTIVITEDGEEVEESHWTYNEDTCILIYSPTPGGVDVVVKYEDSVGNVATLTFGTEGKVLTFTDPHNYPNPFDPEVDGSTSVVGYLSKTCHVTARVFDFAGNHVVTLVEDEVMTHELNSVTWAGADQDGNPVANGVYFCYVEADDGSKVTTAVVKIAVLRGSSD